MTLIELAARLQAIAMEEGDQQVTEMILLDQIGTVTLQMAPGVRIQVEL